ncbi:hypothetical protein C4D60_Mb10t24510 [Musa balbisiana]|uniref:Uncharacterized protein n=1 Tax=Musa balbisiana TaxID=52838 RepID=A0A4S8IZK0_MUSBA|nr:hypothetical protein C4D60_Mb10t24510 [Musa balbisiana]
MVDQRPSHVQWRSRAQAMGLVDRPSTPSSCHCSRQSKSLERKVESHGLTLEAMLYHPTQSGQKKQQQNSREEH